MFENADGCDDSKLTFQSVPGGEYDVMFLASHPVQTGCEREFVSLFVIASGPYTIPDSSIGEDPWRWLHLRLRVAQRGVHGDHRPATSGDSLHPPWLFSNCILRTRMPEETGQSRNGTSYSIGVRVTPRPAVRPVREPRMKRHVRITDSRRGRGAARERVLPRAREPRVSPCNEAGADEQNDTLAFWCGLCGRPRAITQCVCGETAGTGEDELRIDLGGVSDGVTPMKEDWPPLISRRLSGCVSSSRSRQNLWSKAAEKIRIEWRIVDPGVAFGDNALMFVNANRQK